MEVVARMRGMQDVRRMRRRESICSPLTTTSESPMSQLRIGLMQDVHVGVQDNSYLSIGKNNIGSLDALMCGWWSMVCFVLLMMILFESVCRFI